MISFEINPHEGSLLIPLRTLVFPLSGLVGNLPSPLESANYRIWFVWKLNMDSESDHDTLLASPHSSLQVFVLWHDCSCPSVPDKQVSIGRVRNSSHVWVLLVLVFSL